MSVIKTSQLMLYREIIAVCSEIQTKHINTVCGQNVELVNVKPGGTYSDHRTMKGLIYKYIFGYLRIYPLRTIIYLHCV